MIFPVTNDGIEWSLNFGPDSFVPTVKSLVQKVTEGSQELSLASWGLLLSQRQESLNNHIAQIPITTNQEVTMEMRNDVLLSVGAQDMGTNEYQVSDLDGIKFHWEECDLNVDASVQLVIDTQFPPSTFNVFELDSMAENPILIDQVQNK